MPVREPTFTTAIFETGDDAQTLACKRLLWAVMDRAIRDVITQSADVKTLDRRSAQIWISEDLCFPGSFLWACDALGVSASQIRRLCRISSSDSYVRVRSRVMRGRRN